MKYHVTLHGRAVEVSLEDGHATVDGRRIEVRLDEVPGTPLRLLLLDGESFVLAAEPGEAGWRILRRGETVEVEVVDERTRHIRSLVGEGKSHAGAGLVKAPMPGLVVRVLVAVGDRVETGQGLVILEAMKMENELKASGAGVVARVAAEVGRAVEKGEVLLEVAST